MVFGVRFDLVTVMAAHSNNFIRVRLHFDYPPPAVIDCRMCWLLVDLNTCRVVADLESIIRDKFEYSRRSIFYLYIEDYYLPHTESIYLLRDNDSVRVKVVRLPPVNGHSSSVDAASEKSRKRRRCTEEDGPGVNGVSVEVKKKQRKKKSEESPQEDAKQVSLDERNNQSQGMSKEKKKKKKAEESGPAVTPQPPASSKKKKTSVDKPGKGPKKPPGAQAKALKVSSSDSSSSSSEDEAPKKAPARKPASKPPSSTTAAAPKAPPATKSPHTKSRPPSPSSSETTSSSDEASRAKSKPLTSTTPEERLMDKSKSPSLQSTNCAHKQAASNAAPTHDKLPEPGDSDSQEEPQLVIRHQLGCVGGRGRRPITGHSSFKTSSNQAKKPSYCTDSLVNMSVVLQNGAENAPKQDYSSMPLLAAAPQVGQKIAFKLLELTENYSPEVSDYKEGEIVSFDPTTKQVELLLHNAFQAPVEPGKFDLVYENPDGSETVEYAVSRGSRVTERWDSLLEPRLIISIKPIRTL